MKITQVVGRVLVCIECGAHVDVLEACVGATTADEHRWIGEDAYVCGGCLEAAGATVTATTPDTARVAA